MMSLVKLFVLLFFSYTSNFLKAEDEIKIGISTFLSGGAASSFGIPLKQSLEFMFNAINKGDIPAPYNNILSPFRSTQLKTDEQMQVSCS